MKIFLPLIEKKHKKYKIKTQYKKYKISNLVIKNIKSKIKK